MCDCYSELHYLKIRDKVHERESAIEAESKNEDNRREITVERI